MAALVFIACSFCEQVYRVAGVFFNSGGSVSKCFDFICEERRKFLFEKYLKELTDGRVNKIKKMSDYPDSIDWPDENVEILEGFVEDENSTFYDSIDPHLVYSNSNLGEIQHGVSFTIKGKILPNCERFSINLVLDTPTQDIALHVNPRLPQNYIVRNCRLKNVWGTEEVTSALPFVLHRGTRFTIQILITETDYLISINGRHFASFRHRLPYNLVTCLEVKGDVEDVTVDQTKVSQYPQELPETAPREISKVSLVETENTSISLTTAPNTKETTSLDLPYYGRLPELLVDGKRLRIEGRVKMLPHSFYVNFQNNSKIWPHPLIAFHLNPRFANVGGKHVICRNTWSNDKWGREERTEQQTEFVPGRPFTLCIDCTPQSYEIFLNNIFIAEYVHRLDPQIVNYVYIQGDIKLWNVVLEEVPKDNEQLIY